MTKTQVEIGARYLAEIDALEKVMNICNAYGWEHLCDNLKIAKRVSVLGTDYGKPSADPLMTELAKGNRQMFSEMEEIVKSRIDALRQEFDSL